MHVLARGNPCEPDDEETASSFRPSTLLQLSFNPKYMHVPPEPTAAAATVAPAITTASSMLSAVGGGGAGGGSSGSLLIEPSSPVSQLLVPALDRRLSTGPQLLPASPVPLLGPPEHSGVGARRERVGSVMFAAAALVGRERSGSIQVPAGRERTNSLAARR